MINHVTYHVHEDTLRSIHELMRQLAFREVPADDPFEHGYSVRWFKATGSPLVHFVADNGEADQLILGHLCVMVSRGRFAKLKESEFLTRDSGSGRIWLGLGNVRVEVRQPS